MIDNEMCDWFGCLWCEELMEYFDLLGKKENFAICEEYRCCDKGSDTEGRFYFQYNEGWSKTIDIEKVCKEITSAGVPCLFIRRDLDISSEIFKISELKELTEG